MKWLVGVQVAVLLAAIVALERFDAARGTVAEIRDAAGDAAANAASPSLTVWWIVVGATGAVVAWRLGNRLVAASKPCHQPRTKAIVRATVILWVIWMVTGAAPVHYAVIALFVAVLLLAAPSAVGEFGGAWNHASAVRVQILLLLVVYVLFFVVPLTGDQTAEVLRAWGDLTSVSAATRVLSGLAGAVLLGVAIRAGSRRLLALTPSNAPHEHHDAAVVIVIVVLLVGAVALHWWGSAVALGLAGVAVLASRPNTLVVESDGGSAVLNAAEMRVADTLGLVPLVIVTAGLLVATVDSWLLSAAGDRLWLTAITAAVLAVFAVLTGHVYDPHTPAHPLTAGWRVWVAAGAGALAGLAMGVGDHWLGRPVSLVAALLLLGWSVVLALRLNGYDSPLVYGTVAGVGIGVIVAIYLLPVTAPRKIGVLGCVFILLAGLVALLQAAAAWSVRRDLRWDPGWQPWPRHVPLVTLLAVWIAMAFFAAPETAHQARVVDDDDVEPARLADAVGDWVDRAGPGPMLLVGASGGGTKAAYWASLVLDCIAGGPPPDPDGDSAEDSECGAPPATKGPARVKRLFLTSSVSGGSIGVLDFVAHLTHGDKELGASWVKDKVGRDVLSPLTAWGLVHDAPALLLGARTDPNDCKEHGSCRFSPDRAFVQEAAIGDLGDGLDGEPGKGILSVATDGVIPVFNGSISGATGRFVISPLDLAPTYPAAEPCRAAHEDGQPVTGALDADEVLDDKDLPLVTAALLSARFPVLEPPARVGTEDGADLDRGCPEAGTTLPAVRVRDGGYVENTGMLTIADLLPAIRAELDKRRPGVPIIVVSIDDDSEAEPPEPTPSDQKLGPFSVAGRAGTAYLTRKARDTISSCQVADVTYLRISPPPHVGAHAATGWDISETGRRHDLGRALARGEPASHEITEVRRWLDGFEPAPSCVVPADGP